MADSATAPQPGSMSSAPPATTSLRTRLPRVAPLLADHLRLFHGQPRQWTADGSSLQLRAGAATPTDAALVELDADGSRLGLQVTAGADAVPDDALHWQDYQGRARVLAWSLAHEASLRRLSEALGVSLLPLVDAAPRPVGDVVWLDFTLTDSEAAHAPLAGTLRLPSDWLPRLQARAQAPTTVDLGHWRHLSALVRIGLIVPPVAAADYASLRPGDVVLVGTTRLPPLVATAVGRRWPVQSSAEGWRIDGPAGPAPRFADLTPSRLETSPMTQQDAALDAADDTPAQAEDPAARLPVQVEFDIGHVELTLGDIAGLQPGYVFALPTHLEGANVTLRANGRVAGQGELVAVGDTLGVRLLSWS